MTRPWSIALVFVACVAVLLAAVGYLSAEILRLDQEAAAARRQAALEENIRLALWRLDSAVTPLIARESARPYFVYSAFYPAERAYTRMYQELAPGEVLVPSPLLTPVSPYIRLHFQLDAAGELTSPEAPRGNMRELAALRYASEQQLQSADQRLAALDAALAPSELLAALPSEEAEEVRLPPLPVEVAPPQAQQQRAIQQAEAPPQRPQAAMEMQQSAYNMQELQARQRAVDNRLLRQSEYNELTWPRNVFEGPLQPIWHGEELLLARRVRVDGAAYAQGVWLDWPALRTYLLGEIQDLFPEAALTPRTDAAREGQRSMAALPVRLTPGQTAAPTLAISAPVRQFLVIAWGAVLLAALAVAVLLAGSVALGERRAAFVSAVTHELRTPLTTFQLYTDLLSAGLVQDEAKRREYIATLNREAGRLARLVENVLAFARLEARRAAVRVEPLRVGTLLERVRERLAERARLAEFELVMPPPAQEVAGAHVLADAGAVEQILFNLVDNACKYGASGASRRASGAAQLGPGSDAGEAAVSPKPPPAASPDHYYPPSQIIVSVELSSHGVTFRVRDFGDGVPPDVRPKLFRPFHKSAEAAAHSAPGVGLGLALSRRLARRMRGDLRLEHPDGPGAAFVLLLPRP